MKKNGIKSSDGEKTPSRQTETDYAPKTYTPRQQILLAVKVLVLAAIFFVMVWLFNKG